MSTRTAPVRPRRGALRSPLAAATQSPPPTCLPASAGPAPSQPAAANPRSLTLAEFGDYLRTINNRDGRPYQDTSINAYVFPAKALDAWMTANSLDGDFTTVDTAMLNRYFREYHQAHGQGGTHTQQRNLIQLFTYLHREYGHPTPYTAGLNRYAEVRGRPKTLSPSFVDDLLEVTGGGKARDFETARDHAIIRILRSEGIRRQELLSMVMHTLPADLLKNPVLRLVPLKGARNAGEGRLVSLAPATARALAVYLRARRSHKLADSNWVWLGTRNRGRFGNTGIRKMLIRFEHPPRGRWLPGKSASCFRAGLIRDDVRAGTVFRSDHGTRHPHDLGNRACSTLTTPNCPPRHQPVITPLCRGPGLRRLGPAGSLVACER